MLSVQNTIRGRYSIAVRRKLKYTFNRTKHEAQARITFKCNFKRAEVCRFQGTAQLKSQVKLQS